MKNNAHVWALDFAITFPLHQTVLSGWKKASLFVASSPILSGSTLPPTHSPSRAMSSCLPPHKAPMLWLFSQARPPLFLSLYNLPLSLTCCGCCCLSSSVYVPYCSLPRGRRNVRARSQVLCLTAGRGSLHCVQYANQHFCASVLLAFLWKYCGNNNIRWWKTTSLWFCSAYFSVIAIITESLKCSFNSVKLIHLRDCLIKLLMITPFWHYFLLMCFLLWSFKSVW